MLSPTRAAMPMASFVHRRRAGWRRISSDYVLGVYIAPIDTFRILSQSRFDDALANCAVKICRCAANYGPMTAQATYTYSDGRPARLVSTPRNKT